MRRHGARHCRVDGINAAFIDALPNLEIIANFGVGYDAVDARHAAQRGVMVTNTPDVLTEEVADTALGLLINTVRELPRAENWLRDGRWVTRRPLSADARRRCADVAPAFSAWAASALPLRGGWKRSGCRSPITTGARSKASLRIPSDADRPCRGGRYADLGSARRRLDRKGGQRRGPEGARPERRLRQYRPRQHGRRGGADRGACRRHDPRGRPRRLRRRAERAAGADRPAQRLASAACRLGFGTHPQRHGRPVVDNLVSWFSEGKALTPVPETRAASRRAAEACRLSMC